MLEALLKQHVDVNGPLPDGATALHWATYWDDLKSVELLIGAGANVNAANDDGATPLYLVCVNRNTTLVEKLLAAGANVDAALPSGETALMTAARTGSTEIVRILLAHKANVNSKENTHGQTALMWAVAFDHPDVTKALLEADAATSIRSGVRHRSVNTGFTISERKAGIVMNTDLGGFTPLLFAARNGDIELGKLLLAAGANVNDTASSGADALAIAAHSGNGPFAMFLLEHGADPNAAAAGYAPLHAAVLRGDLALVKALLERKADPNAKLVKGTGTRYSSRDFHLNGAYVGATPYWLAAKYGEPEMMRVLAEHGADPKQVAKDGSTPLLAGINAKNPTQLGQLFGRRDRTDTPTEFAARPADEDERVTLAVARIACELGDDPNAANKGGATPLAEAVTRGYESVVRLLIDDGANLNTPVRGGLTPLHIAAQGGHDGIIRLLVAKGAAVDAKNARGMTPLAMTSLKVNDGYLGNIVPEAKLKAAAQALVQLGAKP
jgi:ankyrin repeat protein